MRKGIILAVAMAMLAAAGLAGQGKSRAPAKAGKATEGKLETATFAGGCFWCMQPPFDKTRGVASTVVGYTGGKEKNPTYEQVSSGRTGHRESIQVTFDPAQVTYEQLVDVFWHNINPTQADGQFADVGPQYRTAIFYRSEEQKRIAEESKAKLGKSGKFSKPIAAEILPAGPFYPAEEYHQKYYQKNSEGYRSYAVGSGRYPFLERTWGIKKD